MRVRDRLTAVVVTLAFVLAGLGAAAATRRHRTGRRPDRRSARRRAARSRRRTTRRSARRRAGRRLGERNEPGRAACRVPPNLLVGACRRAVARPRRRSRLRRRTGRPGPGRAPAHGRSGGAGAGRARAPTACRAAAAARPARRARPAGRLSRTEPAARTGTRARAAPDTAASTRRSPPRAAVHRYGGAPHAAGPPRVRPGSAFRTRARIGGPAPSSSGGRGLRRHASVRTSAKWQALGCGSAARGTACGSCVAQTSSAFQQRVRKWQPDGGSAGLGTSPVSRMMVRRSRASGRAPAPPTAAPGCTGGSRAGRSAPRCRSPRSGPGTSPPPGRRCAGPPTGRGR